MMSLRDKILQYTKYQFINDSAVIFLGVICSIFYARMLGPIEYGRFNFLFWFLSTIGVFVRLGFSGTLLRFIALYKGKDDIEKVEKIISTVLITELMLGILLGLVLLIFQTEIASFFKEPLFSALSLIIVFTIIPSCIGDVMGFSLMGLQKIREMALVGVGVQFFTFFCNLSVLLLGYGVSGIIVVNLFIIFLRACILYLLLSRETGIKLSKFVDGSLFREIFTYNFSLFIIVVTDQIIWERSEIFFLQKYSSPDQVAFYSLAFGWGARLIGFLPNILGTFLIPVMSEMFGKDDEDGMKRAFYYLTKYSSFLLIPMTLGALAVSKSFVYVLYGSAYSPLPLLFIPIFLSKGFISCYVAASAIIFAKKRQGFIVKWGITLAMLNIILDFFLIRGFGATGAAWATSIVHFLAAVITLHFIQGNFKFKIPFHFQFKVLLASLPMAVIAYVISMQIFNVFGLIMAVLAGAIAYLLAIRAFRLFSQEDREKLAFLERRLPGHLVPAYSKYFESRRVIYNVSRTDYQG